MFKGAVIGQYALATSLIAYVTIRQHLMMRNKPVFEQTLFVVLMLFLWEIVIWAIDGWTGRSPARWLRWVPVFTGALLWPLLGPLLGARACAASHRRIVCVAS